MSQYINFSARILQCKRTGQGILRTKIQYPKTEVKPSRTCQLAVSQTTHYIYIYMHGNWCCQIGTNFHWTIACGRHCGMVWGTTLQSACQMITRQYGPILVDVNIPCEKILYIIFWWCDAYTRAVWSWRIQQSMWVSSKNHETWFSFVRVRGGWWNHETFIYQLLSES